MKLAVCLALLAVAFASSQWEQRPEQNHNEKAFRAGKHYTYHFDGQVATGLSQPSSQHSATRVQSVVSLVFQSERVALLKLQKTRMGSAHRDLVEPRDLQPFGLFQESPMTQEQKETLALPLRFRYEQGLISDIEFDQQEQPWSANIKRAILNMFQANLQKQNRVDNAEIARLDRDDEPMEKDSQFFTTQESTLEGECETAYTVIVPKGEHEKMTVSKSINFDKCAKRVDIRYNFRFAEECPSCEKKFFGDEQNTESSTVFKFEMNGNRDAFLIRQTEVHSHYLFSPLNKEQNLKSTFVANKLTLIKVDSEVNTVPQPKKPEEKESLVYSTEWEEKLEQFRMTGEEKLIRESPYTWMNKKMEVAREIVRQIQRELSSEHHFSAESNHQVARLVEVLRVCTKEEIKKISQEMITKQSEETKEQQLRDLFYDACAVAGTKNTIEYLTEKTIERQMSPIKAARFVKMLVNLRNPSEQIVDQLIRLCKDDVSEKNPVLKQSCWLTTGAILNGLCGEQRDRLALEVSEKSAPICPKETKEKYVEILEKLFSRASTRYEKVLALKTLANSGMDMIVFPLEKIIRDERQEKTVRIQAIDALRQLRSVMPRKIQALLMPLYKNQQEQPEIRVAAFHQIMHTLPERAVIDQIAAQLEKERNHQVHAFVYTALKSLAKSEVPCEKEMASDIEHSLRMARVQPRKYLDSALLRATVSHNEYYSAAALNFAALFSNDSVLPKEITASLDTVFGGEWNKYLAQIGFSQQNFDQFLWKMLEKLEQNESSLDDVIVRGKRSTVAKPAEALRQLMQKMNIKHRRQQEKNAHAMIYLRYRDLDYAVLPIDEETMPALIKDMFRSGKVDSSEIERVLARGYRFNTDVFSFLYERTRIIPTTLGLPLEITSKMPTVATLEGEIKAELEPKKGSAMEGLRLRIVAKPQIATTHVCHMEVRSPVLSNGVKIMHSVSAKLPIDATIEMNWQKNFDIKTTIKTPTEKSQRVLSIHSRPATYVRHESEENKWQSAVEKTIFLNEQPTIQRIDYTYGEKALGLRFNVEGNVHRHLLQSLEQSTLPIFVTENHLEVVMEKTEETPREFVIRMNLAAFDQESRMEQPKFEGFFEKNNEEVFEVEDSEYQREEESERRDSFKSYAKNFRSEKAYKHRVHIKAEAVGSPVERRAEMEVRATCNEEMTYCKWNVDANRTPLLEGERRQWELKVEGETIYPQPVRSLQQLSEQKHREVQATLQAKWGSDEKNVLNLKLQAEQSAEQQKWQKMVLQKKNVKSLEAVSRLNQIKVVANYEISPATLVQLDRVSSLLKTYNMFNTKIEFLPQQSHSKNGRLFAKMTVEPQTWRYANLTIETPSERLILSDVYLLIRPTYFSIEKSTAQPIRGLRQLAPKATCEVSSNSVNTFDDVIYRTPITTCYSVLAKDCSDEQPKFAVLMKKVQKKGEEKKVKIVTEENVIEIENKRDELIVKVDGKVVKENKIEEFGLEQRGSEIVFENSDIFVRFDGYKVEVHLNELYKNQQCGICGHFDGESENEFRRADNEETDNLEEFHRSYLSQDQECEIDEEQLSKKENYKKFEKSYEQESESSEEYSNEKREQKKFNRFENNEEETVEPEEKTRVMEYSSRICFSKQPVPECPRKTHESEETKEIKVKFACVERSSTQARRLLRESRQQVLSIENLPHSFVETIQVPKACLVY